MICLTPRIPLTATLVPGATLCRAQDRGAIAGGLRRLDRVRDGGDSSGRRSRHLRRPGRRDRGGPGRPAAALFRRRLPPDRTRRDRLAGRSEEHTSELQSLMRISYAVFCLKKKKYKTQSQITM